MWMELMIFTELGYESPRALLSTQHKTQDEDLDRSVKKKNINTHNIFLHTVISVDNYCQNVQCQNKTAKV